MFINQNVNLRTGGRKAPKMSVEEFVKIINKKFKDPDNCFTKPGESFMNHTDGCGFIYDITSYDDEYETSNLSKFYKDCSKIEFDFENRDSVESYLGVTPNYVAEHIRMTKSGVPFIPFAAGGDWERPLLVILYWDGKSFRGYVPTKGNTFNSFANSAFGNNSIDDGNQLKK